MNILIVEDERPLAREMESFLKQYYVCTVAANAAEAEEATLNTRFDFILLDLGLPDRDGFELLNEFKKDMADAAIIVLTARGGVDDRITGLDLGADDYVPKPFSLLELHSRMQAINRRKYKLNDSAITVGDFVINTQTRMIKSGESEIELSKKEFDLLAYLLLHKNRPLSRMQLSEHLWGDFAGDEYDSNYIDVHIKNIRKKLSAFGDVDWLVTVRGIGYKAKL